MDWETELQVFGMITTEISVFKPNSRKKDVTIESLIPRQATDALKERLGTAAARKAETALKMMEAEGMDLVQIRLGDRRIRIKQSS
jgi:hypothetical protein